LTIEGVDLLDLFGHQNHKLNLLRNAYSDIQITSRGNNVRLKGNKKDTQGAKAQLELMVRTLKEQDELPEATVKDMLSDSHDFEPKLSPKNPNNVIVHGRGGKAIKAKTRNQKKLVTASETNDIVFAVGPAGTGKTYTAVALAVRALKNRRVKKIILTRPAVEAGESLGFLPGDLSQKLNPYLKPLYDAMDSLVPGEIINRLELNRVIEIAPLAYMRGRSLKDSYIILDEAQNTTREQMKMFLTRLGEGTTAVITGDITQIDLPKHGSSGLIHATKILKEVDGIHFSYFQSRDVVRSALVKKIIAAYENE
jgi:phosphate starvation-inducible PhoH-like protein